MQTSFHISNTVLTWICDTVRLDILPKDIAVLLQSWKSGEKVPTFNQIEKVSRSTGIPFGYFFMKNPPREELPHLQYRTVGSMQNVAPSRELIDTIHDMELVQDWVREQLIGEGEDPLELVGKYKDSCNACAIADGMREALGLPENWYEDSGSAEQSFKVVRSAISNAGVTVMQSGIVGNNTHRVLDIEEFRAFAMIDEYAPLIFVNGRDSSGAKLFSLVHEFAHICIGHNSLFNDRLSIANKVKPEEQLCNAASAEFLVPLSAFSTEWNKRCVSASPETIIEELARHFSCGTVVIARRALDCGLINESMYHKLANLSVNLYRESLKDKKGGGDYYRTKANRFDSNFLHMLCSSVFQGKTQFTDAFRMTYTNNGTFRRLMATIKGGDNAF